MLEDGKLRIMVTGGAGLIGLEVCRQLNALGHEVRLFDLGEQILRVKDYISSGVKVFYGSVLDSASIRAAISDCDIVIHLAALLGVQRSEANKLRCIEINIEGTKKVLECCVQHRVRKIVFGSSSEVYGEPLENPITDQAITQGKTVYAVTKLAGEEMCKAYAQKYPLEFVILRFFNCYGPHQIAQFVIPKFISNVLRNNPPVVYGGGEQIRSYTYVSDSARGTVLAAFNEQANGQVINIGNGQQPINLVHLAKLVIRIGGKEGSLEPKILSDFTQTDRVQSREIFRRYCDADKAYRLLGWRPQVSIEEGIGKVFEAGLIFERWDNFYDEQN